MGDTKTIVVSGIGKRNALLLLLGEECARQGGRLVGCDAVAWPPARLAVENFTTVPAARDADFRPAYGRMLTDNQAAAYLTLIDPEIVVLGEMEERGEAAGARFLHPVPSVARICEDKYVFSTFLEDASIASIPTSLSPQDLYPFIRKDRCGSAASGFRVFRNRDEFSIYAAESGAGNYIYQPFCTGTHFCIDAYFSIRTGRLADFCAKEVAVKSNGESFLLRAVDRAPFVELLERIAEVLPLRGIVNLDVYDEGGQLKVMEINCRIGGNYPASHRFGCNLLRPMLRDVFSTDAEAVDYSTYGVGQMIAKYFEFSMPFHGSDRSS